MIEIKAENVGALAQEARTQLANLREEYLFNERRQERQRKQPKDKSKDAIFSKALKNAQLIEQIGNLPAVNEYIKNLPDRKIFIYTGLIDFSSDIVLRAGSTVGFVQLSFGPHNHFRFPAPMPVNDNQHSNHVDLSSLQILYRTLHKGSVQRLARLTSLQIFKAIERRIK